MERFVEEFGVKLKDDDLYGDYIDPIDQNFEK